MPRVFISHSSKDRHFVEAVLIPLLNDHGIETWYSADDIKTASRWQSVILEGLRSCEWFLVVLSPDAVSSQWVRSETEWALKNRLDRIVPVLHRMCQVEELSLIMGSIHHVDFLQNIDTARRKLLDVWASDNIQEVHFTKGNKKKYGKIVSMVLGATFALGVLSLAWLWNQSSPEQATRSMKSEGSSTVVPSKVETDRPAFRLSPQLIRLSQALIFLDEIVGMYAEKNGIIVLVGKSGPNPCASPLLLEDLAFSASHSLAKDARPFGCTLELPSRNSTEWLINVRYYGGVENSHVGLGLFKADLALKEYSLGVRTDGKRIQSAVEGYVNMLKDLENREYETNVSSARFWFSTSPVLNISDDGALAIVTNPGISVSFQGYKWEEGEFTQSSKAQETYNAFAEKFSRHFEEFAVEEPSLAWFSRFSSMNALMGRIANVVDVSRIDWLEPMSAKKYVTPMSLKMISSQVTRSQALSSGNVMRSTTELTGGITVSPSTRHARIVQGYNDLLQTLHNGLPLNLGAYEVGTAFDIDTPDQSHTRYRGVVINSIFTSSEKH